MRLRLITTAALAATLVALQASAQPADQPAAPAAAASATPEVSVTNVGASVNITPKRMTLDKAKRNGTVFIQNQGESPVTVDITLVDRVMMPDGQIITTEAAAKRPDAAGELAQLHSAKDDIQISPRRVMLAPGKGQTVRLRLASLPEGASEFRTHLTVTTIPPRDTGTTAEQVANGPGAKELRFRINAVYGVSIPLIVRTQPAEVGATLADLRVERLPGSGAPVLTLDIKRTGPSSVYGNFEVRPAGAKKGSDPIGLARGVGVYPEVDHRLVRIPLTREPAPGEKLEVTFTDDDTSPGKVLAKATL
jgi:P pilus assembly chaperone PapD